MVKYQSNGLKTKKMRNKERKKVRKKFRKK